jgi:hypothetical protein
VTATEAFEAAILPVLGRTGVTEGTGFGKTPGLKVSGKIFAMLAHDELVVKLPRERVDALVGSGAATRFDPRSDGRLMREWASVPVTGAQDWPALVAEAYAFVAG